MNAGAAKRLIAREANMKVGMIGAGNMGFALLTAMAPHADLYVYDINPAVVKEQAGAVRRTFKIRLPRW